MNDLPAFWPALPELFLASCAITLLIVGVFITPRFTALIGQLSVMALVVTGILMIGYEGEPTVTFNELFILDGFALFMKLLILIGSILALLMSHNFIKHEQMDRFEFPILILFATLGMMMMVSANDIIALYLGLETQSLTLYIMATFRRDSAKSSEAGLKYFLLGALSSGLLLYGASLVYGYTGSTNFQHIALLIQDPQSVSLGLIIGMVFVSAGLIFKLSAVPFHMWTPDVYEGAPTEVTAFLAMAPKVAAMALFLRLLYEPFGNIVILWQQIIIVVSVASMILGALAALYQTSIKRLMAYSAIGHIGYALVGLAAGTKEGLISVIIYMTIYLIMTAGTFMIILCMRRQGRLCDEIHDLAGLSQTHPLLALAATMFMFSMAGLPPLAGFFGKFYVFMAAVHAQLYILAIIAVVTSVIAAFYYLRIIKLIYFDTLVTRFDSQKNATMASMIFVTCTIITFFFVYPLPIVDNATYAAQWLFTK